MLATFLASFTTYFATIGPIEAAVLFAAFAPAITSTERRRIAIKAVGIAALILAGAALFGRALLTQLGVSLAALQAAGGIILLMIALEMVFARPTSAFRLSPPEGAEAQSRDDLAVFPLATPLLAGPGAMSASILLAANTKGDATLLAVTMSALAAVLAITLGLLVISNQLSRILGVTAQRVLMRVFGILLAAIAVQAMFDGIAGSGLIGGPPRG